MNSKFGKFSIALVVSLLIVGVVGIWMPQIRDWRQKRREELADRAERQRYAEGEAFESKWQIRWTTFSDQHPSELDTWEKQNMKEFCSDPDRQKLRDAKMFEITMFPLATTRCDEQPDQQPEEVQHAALEDRRAAYTTKINAWLTRQWGGGAEYSGDVLTLVAGGANVRDETALACVVAQLEIPPPPYFRRVRIVTVNLETRTLQEQISSSLPINRPIPKGCELPPPGFLQ